MAVYKIGDWIKDKGRTYQCIASAASQITLKDKAVKLAGNKRKWYVIKKSKETGRYYLFM